jgi:hypothetical protein
MWQNLPRPHLMQPFLLQTELLYPLFLIAICLFIFFRTKTFYSLTNHRGIYFFRQTFLFFALAYFFRFLPLLFRLTDFHLIQFRIAFLMGLFIFGFASSMALLSLARSIIWKDISSVLLTKPYFYYILSFLLPFTIFISLRFFLYTQLLLLAFVLLSSHLYHKKRRTKTKSSSMYYTYILLGIVWILNVVAITIPPFAAKIKLLLYVFSLFLFMVILYRVVLKTKVR